jgi:hypothetical protein
VIQAPKIFTEKKMNDKIAIFMVHKMKNVTFTGHFSKIHQEHILITLFWTLSIVI